MILLPSPAKKLQNFFGVFLQFQIGVDRCFDAANNYRPEYVEPMIRATVLQMCTNIPPIVLKNESDDDGMQVLDLDAMSNLYLLMDFDNLNSFGFKKLLYEMRYLCWESIEWRNRRVLSDCGVDAALRQLIGALTTKVENTDIESLMQYAGQLAKATKNLDEDGLLKGIVEFGQKEAKSKVVDITDRVGM